MVLEGSPGGQIHQREVVFVALAPAPDVGLAESGDPDGKPPFSKRESLSFSGVVGVDSRRSKAYVLHYGRTESGYREP
jgi:hypothetical protein